MQNPNSLTAYKNVKPNIKQQNALILEALQSALDGLTREELEDATGIPGNSIRPRVLKLLDEGVIIEKGRRPTRAGNPAAILYMAPPHITRPAVPGTIDEALAELVMMHRYEAADIHERGVWLTLWMYCIKIGTGTIKGGKNWPADKWQDECGLCLVDIQASKNLIKVDGDDIKVICFPNNFRKEGES